MIRKHKIIALIASAITIGITVKRRGVEPSIIPGMYIMVPVLGIMFNNTIASLAGFGFWESLAKDKNINQSTAPYTVLFWILLIISCSYYLFNN